MGLLWYSPVAEDEVGHGRCVGHGRSLSPEGECVGKRNCCIERMMAGDSTVALEFLST